MAYLKYPCWDRGDVFRHTHPHTTTTTTTTLCCTYAPSTVQLLKTYNTIPRIDYWPVEWEAMRMRKVSSSFCSCAVANRDTNAGLAVARRRWPKAAAILTRSPAVNMTIWKFRFNRSRRYLYAANIHYQHFTSLQLSWTLLRCIMRMSLKLRVVTFSIEVNCQSFWRTNSLW